jgi:HTH-type transcriptional regulator/antitoxin HigA
LRRGEIESAAVKTQPFDPNVFRSTLQTCRTITMEPTSEACNNVRSECAAAGVIVLFVPELSGAKVSGASRWLTPHRPLIQLSLRCRKDDQLWFSFFHEAGHILLHQKKGIFIDIGKGTSLEEKEADAFAANMLIPDDAFETFAATRPFSAARVIAFAKAQGIAPGIVVGRLQHEGLMPFNTLNHLKRPLEWTAESCP